MKLVFVTILAVLLSCSCSSGIELNYANGGPKTRFSDLDNDVLYNIFYYLEMDDLFNLIEIHSDLSLVTGTVFHYKYGVERLEIVTKNRRGYGNITPRYKENAKKLSVFDIRFALNVLKHFGSYFQAIKFSYVYELDVSDLDKVIRLLTEKCSNSLEQLELEMKDDLLAKFTRPFEAVQELTIKTPTYLQLSARIRLDELFPQLRRLNLWSDRAYPKFHFIDNTFPHLEHFGIRAMYKTNSEYVKELILKNPTIQSIAPNVHDPQLFQFISQNLPNLTNLTIHHDINEHVDFENVKNLQLLIPQIHPITNDIDAIDKLSVPRMESLRMNLERMKSGKWEEFVQNHAQLRRLHIFDSHITPSDDPFRLMNRFTADLSNLMEFSFTSRHKYYYNAESVIQFIESHSKLNSYHLVNVEFHSGQQEILHESLGNEWIIDFHSNDASFDRKQPILE